MSRKSNVIGGKIAHIKSFPTLNLFQRKRHHLFPCPLETAKIPPSQTQTAAISQLIWTNEEGPVCPELPK